MKIKHLIIVSLILTILTIGVVSASEDINETLTLEDEAADDVAAFDDTLSIGDEGVDEVAAFDDTLSIGDEGVDEVAAFDDSIGLQNDGKNDIVSENPQIDINFEKKVYVDDVANETLEGDSFAIIHYRPEGDVEGNVTVEIKGILCFNKELKYCYCYDESLGSYHIRCCDLNPQFGVGIYDIAVRYVNGSDSISQTGTVKFASVNDPDPVNINLERKIYIDDEFDETLEGDTFAVIEYLADGDIDGNISVEVEGYDCFNKELKKCTKYGESSNIFIIRASDLNRRFGVGTYEVVVFYNNGFDKLSKTKNVKFASVNDPNPVSINLEKKIYIDDVNNETLEGDTFAIIEYLADGDVEGNVTVEIDGTVCFNKELKNCTKYSESGNLYIIWASDLNPKFTNGTYEIIVFYDNGFDKVVKSRTVKFASVNDPNPVNINLERKIYIDDVNNETLEGDTFAVIEYVSSGDVVGNVTVEIDGTVCFNKELKKCTKYGESGNLYIIGASDLNPKFGNGTYEIIVSYDNGFDSVVKTVSVTFASVNGANTNPSKNNTQKQTSTKKQMLLS